jgi:putative endonuclease
MIQKRPCVYILASRRNGTLYIGVTSNLVVRIYQHRSNAVAGFVQDYGVHRLVFCGVS